MPRRKVSTATPPVETPIQPDVISQPKSYNPFLIGALIVVTFLLGMAVMKVQTLEKSNTAATQPVPTTTVAQPTLGKQNVSVGHLPPKGNPDAKIKIVMFEDLRCPFCKEFTLNTESQIIKDYVGTGKAVLYFRHFDFLGPASTTAANAAECANEQGKFWEFHDYMYQNQPDESDTSMYTNDKLTSIAANLGMNSDQFSSCLTASKYNNQVATDLADGQKAGVSGTPTVFINGTPIVGALPYSGFKTAIDQELNKK